MQRRDCINENGTDQISFLARASFSFLQLHQILVIDKVYHVISRKRFNNTLMLWIQKHCLSNFTTSISDIGNRYSATLTKYNFNKKHIMSKNFENIWWIFPEFIVEYRKINCDGLHILHCQILYNFNKKHIMNKNFENIWWTFPEFIVEYR